MKKFLSFILALVMVATMFATIVVPASAYDAGKAEGSVYDGTMDKTWYNAEDPKTEYTLYTAAELAGLADLVNTDGVKFLGVTIKLGADIIWNDGTLTADENGQPLYNGQPVSETNQPKTWPVIGYLPSSNNGINSSTATHKFFLGNFDGQGHVISGLYAVNNDKGYVGLFSVFAGEFLKNVSVINSYFSCKHRTGSIAGYVSAKPTGTEASFTAENLYSDAYIYNSNGANGSNADTRTGGIFGMIRYSTSTTLKNLWYNGTIKAVAPDATKLTPHIGGIVGVICQETETKVDGVAVPESVVIENCLMTGSIYGQIPSAESTAAFSTGGIVADIFSSFKQINVSIKNCYAAVKNTNLVVTEKLLPQTGKAAIVGFLEKPNYNFTFENCYYVANGVYSRINPSASAIDANGDRSKGYVNVNNGTIYTATELETEILANAKVTKPSEATGLSAETFEITDKTIALKGVRTALLEKQFSIWDGTVDTSWFDINDIKTEYTLTTAAQLAGLAEIVDNYPTTKDGDKTVYGKPFLGVTIKLGANIVLNNGTFTLGADKKTAVYNGALISATNPVNVWNPIGVSYNGGNNCNPTTTNAFWGNFDGQGYVISGMYVNNPATQQQGLFGIFAGSELKNVVITNSYVLGNSRNGSVVGFVANAKTSDVAIKNIYSDAFVVSTSADANLRSGGIFGMFMQCLNVTIEDVEFAGVNSGFVGAETKAAGQLLGGIIGVIKGEIADKTYTIKNCKMTGSIYNNYNGKDNGGQVRCGGIMGGAYKFYGSIINCSANLADTNITAANGFKADKVGGMVGYHENVGAYTYENCEFTHIGLFTKGMDATTTFNNDTCTVNGMNKAEWLADTTGKDVATGTHAYTDVAAKEATCTEAGVAAHKTCACGALFDADGAATDAESLVVAAKGHTYGEWVAPVDPTETAAGVLGHYQCSVCKKYFDADKNEMTSIEGAPALGTTPGTDPGTTPGTDPGTTPGTDPGTTPGTDPGTTPGTEPGVPGTEPGTPDTEPGTPDTEPGTPDTEPGTTPTTNAPTTDAPVKEKGCGKKNGGFAAVVALVAIMGAAIVIKKK